MKLIALFVCAVLAHVNAQCGCGCGCSNPAPCRLLPPRPLPPCPRFPPPPRTCPPPIVVDCPPRYEVLPPPPTTTTATPVVALPSCNCPTVPSLPVSPQILPFLSNLGCISPCLGGLSDFSLYPLGCLGMINPFLPAASPVSALAPTVSPFYPPINPCNCGCKHLKKIPFPPPCL